MNSPAHECQIYRIKNLLKIWIKQKNYGKLVAYFIRFLSAPLSGFAIPSFLRVRVQTHSAFRLPYKTHIDLIGSTAYKHTDWYIIHTPFFGISNIEFKMFSAMCIMWIRINIYSSPSIDGHWIMKEVRRWCRCNKKKNRQNYKQQIYVLVLLFFWFALSIGWMFATETKTIICRPKHSWKAKTNHSSYQQSCEYIILNAPYANDRHWHRHCVDIQ